MRSVRVVCLTTAVTRLTHMAGVAGNEAIVSRDSVTTPDGDRRAPAWVSGNALRHVCVRAPGARWLVSEYGLDGRLSLAQLNFLFHGGALTESTGREPTARVAELHECLPLFKLLGGALPDQILQGSLATGPAVLVCEENRPRLEVVLGADVLAGLPPLASGESYLESYQYVTFGARAHEAALAERATDFAASASDPRMLYVGQCVRPGATFAHEFILRDTEPRDVGCLLWSLELWRRSGGVVGGMGAKGHGRTDAVALVEGADGDAPGLVSCYLDHARRHRDRAVAWLEAAFARPVKPKGKGRKKSEPAGEAAE